ncbi:MAG: DUF2163 domain-containing protein [Polymorphobacter sp.]|uniref:DUF2163 domain-containing protein n=1 Tax=Polymorphobacter sp. TaxID=1909290 RepID=UPI003A8AD620
MSDFSPRLEAPLTSLALCWRVVRADGAALGFTSHDRPLMIDGMRYESAPGMTPSAIERGDGLDIDTLEVSGALASDSIAATDLLAGRYDGASLSMFMVDWAAPDAGRRELAQGRLGTVQAGAGADAGFVAELRGPKAVFLDVAVESYSPECRAELGDRRCKVDLRGRTLIVESLGADGSLLRLPEGWGDGEAMLEGIVRVMAGPSAGLERRVVARAADGLLLDEPLDLATGTPVRLQQGCDKRFATCVGRFGNGQNFRGEPHVPGGDLLTRIAGL